MPVGIGGEAAAVVGRAVVPGGDGRLRLTSPLRLGIARGHIAAVTPLAAGQAPPPAGRDTAGGPQAILLPGLIDSHVHLVAAAADRLGLDLAADHPRTLPELLARLAEQDARLAPGVWLRASGFDEHRVAERRPPTRAELDRAVAGRPLRLREATRHASLLNTLALARLEAAVGPRHRGATPSGDGASPSAMVYGLDREITHLAGALPVESLEASLAAVGAELARHAVVSLDEPSGGNDARRVALLARAVAAGMIAQRVRVLVADADELEAARRAADGLLEICGVKLFAHDADQARSAALAAAIARARRAGVVLAIHAVEPDVIDAVLDALQAAPPRRASAASDTSAPDRIEHASLCPPALARRIARSGIAVVTQPSFVVARAEKYRAEVEAPLWPWLYPLRTLLSCGVTVAAGSDAPVGPLDPRIGLQAALARRSSNGMVLGEDERLSEVAALGLFTTGARRLRGEPAVGRGLASWLEPGAPADLAVLDGHPTHDGWEALATRSLVVGGRVHHLDGEGSRPAWTRAESTETERQGVARALRPLAAGAEWPGATELARRAPLVAGGERHP